MFVEESKAFFVLAQALMVSNCKEKNFTDLVHFNFHRIILWKFDDTIDAVEAALIVAVDVGCRG